MFTHCFRILRSAPAAVAAAALVLGGCASATPGTRVTLQATERTITVVGRGEVSAKPDIARAVVGIDVTAKTLAEAMNEARTRMNKVMATLKQLGIPEKDIRTSNYSINFERAYAPPMPVPVPMPMPEAPKAPAPKSGAHAGKRDLAPTATAAPAIAPPEEAKRGVYHVSNMVEVTIRDLDQVSTVLDTTVDAGANNVWGVSFGLEATKELEAQAREEAVADAKKRAEALARLSGVTLGPVLSLSEIIGSPAIPYPIPYAKAAQSDVSTPVAPGEVTLATQIQMAYAIHAPIPRE